MGARGQPARHAGVPGRHFIELQCVARVLDPVAADAFGLRLDQLTVLIEVLGDEIGRATQQVYDVAHNVAKLEVHGGR